MNVERRALLALFRNHPETGPGDRYNWKASAEARRQREMLLDWAATKPDEELLWCRNLGPVALRWIRKQRSEGTTATPAPLDEGRLARVMRGMCDCIRSDEDAAVWARDIATGYAVLQRIEAPDEGNEWQERNE